MPWTRKEKGLLFGNLAITVILAILLASALSGAFTAQVQQPQQVRLVIEHYDANGQLVDTRVKEGDLFLKNYAMIIRGMFDKTYSADFAVTDTSGTIRYINVWGASAEVPFDNAGFEYGDFTGWTKTGTAWGVANPTSYAATPYTSINEGYYAALSQWTGSTDDVSVTGTLTSPQFILGEKLIYHTVGYGTGCYIEVRRASDDVVLYTLNIPGGDSWVHYELDTSTVSGTLAYIFAEDNSTSYWIGIDGIRVIYATNYGSSFFATRNSMTSIKIHIGTGTTAPAITDTVLVSEVDAQEVNLVSYAESGNTMTITVQATFNFTASYAITEAGLSFSDYSAASASGGKSENISTNLLLFRDTFTAVNVASGDSLVVKYQIQFNA
jgi:hypothetical protein